MRVSFNYWDTKATFDNNTRTVFTTNIMGTAKSIDSISKNLQAEYEVAKQLSSKQIPIHLLCKLVCEKLYAKLDYEKKLKKKIQVWSHSTSEEIDCS